MISLKFSLIILLSFLLAVAIHIQFKLILTLPLLCIGLGILATQKCLKDQKLLRLVVINLGLLISAFSVLFSFLNISYISDSSTSKITTRQEGDYGSKGSWLRRQYANGLGYKYKANLRNHRSRKIAIPENGSREVVYDVVYNIDERGNRITPLDDLKTYRESNNAILFLGDSFTFGEGLNDNETLSYFLQKFSNRPALNTGMHGYGTHQALRILEDNELYHSRTKDFDVTSIIYRALPDHVNRAAGYSPWDNSGPCYKVNNFSQIEYKGSFQDCGKRNRLIYLLVRRFTKSVEPYTADLFKSFTSYGKFANTKYRPKDVDRFLLMTKKMEEISAARGANFYLIFEDVGTDDATCSVKTEHAIDLAKRLKTQHKNIILTSDVYSRKVCSSSDLIISQYDKHPNKYANQILSDHLVKTFF